MDEMLVTILKQQGLILSKQCDDHSHDKCVPPCDCPCHWSYDQIEAALGEDAMELLA